MNRRGYFLALLLIVLASTVASEVATSRDELAWIGVIALVASAAIAGMRSADIGQSRWWLVLYLIPFLNVILGCRLLALPSGYAHHKKIDRAMNVIAGTFIAVFGTITIGLIAFFVATPSASTTPNAPIEVRVASTPKYSDPSLQAVVDSRNRAFKLYPFLDDPENPWRKKLDAYVENELARKERAQFFIHLDWPERIVIEFLAKNGLLNRDGSLKKL